MSMLLRGDLGGGPPVPELQRRLRWVVVVVVAAFAALIGRLWQLQVVRGDEYYAQTLSNVVHERFLPSIRGQILDRKGEPLASNRPAFNIYVTPRTFTPAVSERFTELLDLSDEEIDLLRERVNAGFKRSPTTAMPAFEDQSRDRAALIKQSSFQLPGVFVRDEPHRFYPHQDLAAHLIGYMNQMTAAEYDKYAPQGYTAAELIGRYGLERAWENYLRGKKGIERYAVNAKGQRIEGSDAADLIKGDPVIEPVAGHNLILTMDADLQRLAERAVSRHAAAAVAVVEVNTGKVLALVSKPSFEPNTMTGHLSARQYKELLENPRKPFIDKALRQHYPPGSTYKFVAAVAALEDGVIDEEERLVCPGYFHVGNERKPFRCTSSHGKVNMAEAIQHSCNVYFWKLAEQIGIDRMAEVAMDFGFGAPTGMGLNGDVPGRVPTRAGYDHFTIGFTINAATGQGDVTVTVMQLAMAYAALANGGKLYVPQVVQRIETAGGDTVVAYEPKLRRKVKMSPMTVDILRRGMRMVVNELGGTAYEYARSDQVEYAGKTGTAEVDRPDRKRKRRKDEDEETIHWQRRSHGWFAGYAPASAPEIAVVVLIEHGGQGGKVAGPVARRIIEGYFQMRRGTDQGGAAPGPAGGS
jgi:penicillin-binding protein 2